MYLKLSTMGFPNVRPIPEDLLAYADHRADCDSVDVDLEIDTADEADEDLFESDEVLSASSGTQTKIDLQDNSDDAHDGTHAAILHLIPPHIGSLPSVTYIEEESDTEESAHDN
ncbi:hypothetical protein L6452_01861 [Arctium lappa]|uniref:Uncharacterized protein n=1 Tax=Arctium lappa TaxID=4217 RepID=A0ACB9FHY3_ARCLA|nr:hypothetical protein L6452_01861 [Arctium lappa]